MAICRVSLILRRCSVQPSTPLADSTNSSAWQDVAPYSSRHSQDCLPERQVKGSRASCIWAFLINLKKMTFSTGFKDLILIT
jgi:hypothetical protein